MTTPAWRTAELHADGFLKFNEQAAKNLGRLVDLTNASIILTTTHRINYSDNQWKELLRTRGIHPCSVSKINGVMNLSEMAERATEIKEWIDKQSDSEKFVIIDDDLSLNGLPTLLKEKCILTKPMIGLDNEATDKALSILLDK